MGPEIFLSAAAATAIVTAIFGYLFVHLVKPEDRRTVLTAALLAVPMELAVVALVYLPQQWWVGPWVGTGIAGALMLLLTAPLVEEFVKWLVLFAPPVRRALRPDNAAAIALAIGFGFAVAEFWTQSASMVGHPGFKDRLLIALTQPVAWSLGPFVHGGFVLFFAQRLAQGRSLWPGALVGIGLHLAINVAASVRWGDFMPPLLALTLPRLVGIGVYAVLAVAIVRGLGDDLRRLVHGPAVACPSCGEIYERPWASFNLGLVSYERCPHCKRLQWVRHPLLKPADTNDKPQA